MHHVLHRYLSMLVIALALTALAAWPATVFAQIQLDGDAEKSTGTGSGTDWDEILLGNGGGAVATTGLVVDRPEPSFGQFTGGGSKDQQDISNWRWRSGSPLDKDDLSHAFAAAFTKNTTDGPHTILAFGMDRYDTSGNAQLGFWFLAQNAQPVAGGTFNGTHQDGDLLVLVNFANGGTIPNLQVYKWMNGAVVSQGIGGTVSCSGGTIPGAGFCGITNAVSVHAPWTYENKDVGATTSFPSGAFFEGGIDLTALGLTGCFTGFIAESRSSTSITATLKDFSDPGAGFNLCSISVNKECASPVLSADQKTITYIIRGTVTNTGSGTVYNVDLSDNPAADPNGTNHFNVTDCATKTQDLGDFPVSSMVGGAQVCYKSSITVPLANGNKDTITVTANSKSDLTGTTLKGSATADCPDATIVAALTVTKNCETVLETVGSNLVVKVNASGSVCNSGGAGGSNLSQVTVADTIGSTTTTVLSGATLQADIDPTSAVQGECKPYSFSYYPSGANSTTPGSVCFQDTVTATAKDIFGATVNAVPAIANCSLCPGTKCPPSTP